VAALQIGLDEGDPPGKKPPGRTPPAHRGHGCATSLVAHASTWALGSGAIGCTLFTDLAHPVSNRIYERIGYRRVGTRATVAW
jgi:predicted GNAT family acetyltransferase